MKRQPYYPSRIASQVLWLTNYADKVAGYATTLGLSAPGITGTVADAKWLIYVLGAWLGDVRTFAQGATSYIEVIESGLTGGSALPAPLFTPPTPAAGTVAVPAGALNRIFAFVQEIKSATGYTTIMGEDLGIIGAAMSEDHPSPKVTLKLGQGATCQCVDIYFIKYTHQGVYIESRRNEGNWEFLGIDTEKPYTDDRPLLAPGQAEVREYRLRFWDKGTPNGPWSDVAKIAVAP